MRKELEHLFESRAKEYITPHYWKFLVKIVDTYLEANTPTINIYTLVQFAGATRMTYYRFCKRFYGGPDAFWDLMEEARIANNKKEEVA